jgi:hypothetical protein
MDTVYANSVYMKTYQLEMCVHCQYVHICMVLANPGYGDG